MQCCQRHVDLGLCAPIGFVSAVQTFVDIGQDDFDEWPLGTKCVKEDGAVTLAWARSQCTNSDDDSDIEEEFHGDSGPLEWRKCDGCRG